MPRRGLDTEQVVQAAISLADEGLENATFARIAARLGVKPPSLYNHVNGRTELLELMALRGLLGLGDAIAAAAAGRSGGDALRATAHAYREYALSNPGCYEAALVAPPDGGPEIRAAADRLLGLLGAILRAWQLEGEQGIDAIRALRSALHGFVVLQRAGGFRLPRDAAASFERLIDILIGGLAALDSGDASEAAGG